MAGATAPAFWGARPALDTMRGNPPWRTAQRRDPMADRGSACRCGICRGRAHSREAALIPSTRQPDHGRLCLFHESAVADDRSVVAPQKFAVVVPRRTGASFLLLNPAALQVDQPRQHHAIYCAGVNKVGTVHPRQQLEGPIGIAGGRQPSRRCQSINGDRIRVAPEIRSRERRLLPLEARHRRAGCPRGPGEPSVEGRQ